MLLYTLLAGVCETANPGLAFVLLGADWLISSNKEDCRNELVYVAYILYL